MLDRSHGLHGSVAGTVRGSWARRHGPGPAPAGGSGVLSQETAGHGTVAAVQGGTGTPMGGGMETSNRCLQVLLRRGDSPLPASVILDGEKLPVSFVAAAVGAPGSLCLLALLGPPIKQG